MWLAAVVFIPLVMILSLIAIGIPANLFLLKSKFSAGFASSSTVIQALIFLSVSLMFLTVQVVDRETDFREDKPEHWESRAELMKNVPEKADGFIKVPVIIDKDDNE